MKKVEVGKYYRSREGRKVFIFTEGSFSIMYPYKARDVETNKVWTVTENGQVYVDVSNPDERDIVSEWDFIDTTIQNIDKIKTAAAPLSAYEQELVLIDKLILIYAENPPDTNSPIRDTFEKIEMTLDKRIILQFQRKQLAEKSKNE